MVKWQDLLSPVTIRILLAYLERKQSLWMYYSEEIEERRWLCVMAHESS